LSIGQRPAPRGPQRGEIYRVTFREVGGHDLSGPHWAVVVQASRMASSSTTLVAPITTNAPSAHLEPPYLVRVSAKAIGLSWDGWIHADQLFTFPSSELEQRVAVLPGRAMEALDEALRFVLDL
jgi:mRNA-degrading endonuclease toxin of MazEF toxin-antitoxin module